MIAMEQLTFVDWILLLDLIDDQLKTPHGLGTFERLTKILKRKEVLSVLKEKVLKELDLVEFLDLNEVVDKGIRIEGLKTG